MLQPKQTVLAVFARNSNTMENPNPQELVDEFNALNKKEGWVTQAVKKAVTVSTLEDESGITIMRGKEHCLFNYCLIL